MGASATREVSCGGEFVEVERIELGVHFSEIEEGQRHSTAAWDANLNESAHADGHWTVCTVVAAQGIRCASPRAAPTAWRGRSDSLIPPCVPSGCEPASIGQRSLLRIRRLPWRRTEKDG